MVLKRRVIVSLVLALAAVVLVGGAWSIGRPAKTEAASLPAPGSQPITAAVPDVCVESGLNSFASPFFPGAFLNPFGLNFVSPFGFGFFGTPFVSLDALCTNTCSGLP